MLLDMQRQRTLIENMIATLIGVPASEFALAPSLITEEPPKIPQGSLPTCSFNVRTLHRPNAPAHRNMRRSEWHTLHFFPSISLTGHWDIPSRFREFLSWISRLWSMERIVLRRYSTAAATAATFRRHGRAFAKLTAPIAAGVNRVSGSGRCLEQH